MGELQSLNKKLIIARDYVKKNGTSALSIYVSIDGKFDRIPLKLDWPANFFDQKSGKLLARQKDDQDYIDYQLIIDTELSKVNEIFGSGLIAFIGKEKLIDK